MTASVGTQALLSLLPIAAVALLLVILRWPASRAMPVSYMTAAGREWEYACRAETTGRWHFGDQESALGVFGWTNADSDWQTHSVGQKKSNPWGLYNVYGNVLEWCQDWAGRYPQSAVTDPTGAASGDRRCLRGGSWNHPPSDCRAAFRRALQPSYRGTDLGFRAASP